MLGTIVLLMCLVASVAAVAIVFILYGPVPVRRKVLIIARVSAPDPFVDQPAARMIGLSQPQAPSAMPPIAPQVPAPMHALRHEAAALPIDASSSLRARTPSPSAANTIPVATARAATPDVAPLVLRRPGNPNPPALSRARAARGTEPRPRPSAEEIQAIDEVDIDDPTSQVTLVEHDEFIEDGR